MEFFIADTHFYHEKLLLSEHFSPRPYNNLPDEHAGLIDAWNQRVDEKDTVYHLGDIAMMNHVRPEKHAHELVADILNQLKGHIVFIKGNHDSRSLFKYLAAHNPVLADGNAKFDFEDVGAYCQSQSSSIFLNTLPIDSWTNAK